MKKGKLKLFALIAFFILAIEPVFSQAPIPDIFSPTFSYLSGRYNSDILVQLTTSTPNALIYYTLDGTEPDVTSQQYIGNISISGDGNYKTLKAITISQDTLKSLISSAIYIIDYSFNPNASYLTNLTWGQYNNFIQGDWFGYASTPWTTNYCVKLSILPNGNYIDTTTSGNFSSSFDDVFLPVFYYGITNVSPLKTITLYNILASGYANGYITIDFGFSSTNQDELRYIKFIDDKNLYLEMWHQSQYGPLKYYLTKKNPDIPTSIPEYQNESILIYPNPVSDFLCIKNLNSNVQLINQLGQSFILEKSEIITVSSLPKGLYFILFQNTAGVQVKQKIVLE